MGKMYFDTVTMAAKYRGEILNAAIFLENQIDKFIANHFAPDDEQKNWDLTVAVLGNNRMSFDGKKQVFEYLSNKYDNVWVHTYQPFREIEVDGKKKTKEIKYHGLYADLQHVINQRNIFAHCTLDLSMDALNENFDLIRYVRFRDEKKCYDFGKKEINELKFLIEKLAIFILAGTNTIHHNGNQ